jgi:hypothetical protein
MTQGREEGLRSFALSLDFIPGAIEQERVFKQGVRVGAGALPALCWGQARTLFRVLHTCGLPRPAAGRRLRSGEGNLTMFSCSRSPARPSWAAKPRLWDNVCWVRLHSIRWQSG